MMMKKNAYQQYKQTQFETANQEKLILMLYDGALKYLRRANKGFEDKDYEIVNDSLTKSQDIINELLVSLNMEAGELAQHLYQLYDYMRRRLIEANLQKSKDPVQEVIEMIAELRDTWQQGVMNVQKENGEDAKNGGLSLEG